MVAGTSRGSSRSARGRNRGASGARRGRTADRSCFSQRRQEKSVIGGVPGKPKPQAAVRPWPGGGRKAFGRIVSVYRPRGWGPTHSRDFNHGAGPSDGNPASPHVDPAPEGGVERVRLTSKPRRLVDVMELSAAKAWKFDPALKDGQPVRYRFELVTSVPPSE